MAPPMYKSATPALNEKLQQYRDDPEALADLHKRVRQHQKERASQAVSGRPPSAPASPSGTHRALSSPHTAPGTPKTARNFIEENAALVSPWPCTGPLSSKAIAAAQQQRPPWEDLDRLGSGDAPDLIVSPTSPTWPESAATPARPGSAAAAAAAGAPPERGAAAGSKRYPALTLNLASLGACGSSLQQQQQQKAAPSGWSNSSTLSPSDQATATPASRHAFGSSGIAAAHTMSRCSSSSMSRSAGQGASSALGCEAETAAGLSCVELLATQMAAKKEAAAARAVGAAERRAVLAAEQQRMDAVASRGQRREAERAPPQQVEAGQSVTPLRQQAWLGVVAATSMTGQLAAALKQQQQRGAAARFIAAAYKSCRLRRRQREMAQLVVRLRRLLKPCLAAQRAAAHGRCAERLLSFLQCSTSASMLVCAAQRLRHHVTIIQSCWRQVRLVRAAQESLLMQALKQLEQRLVLHNKAAAAGRGSSSTGSRANHSSSSGTRQLRVAGDVDVGSRSRVDRSNSRADHSSSNHEAGASAAEPIMRGGGPLIRPHEFFLDESPSPAAAGHSSSSGVPGIVPAAAAAALPHGPMPARGVQMTGQLTMHPWAASAAGSSQTNSSSSSSNLAAEDLGARSSSNSQAEPAVRSVTISDNVHGPSSASSSAMRSSSSFRSCSQSAAPQAASRPSSSSSCRGRSSSSSVSPVKPGSGRPASARPTSARPASASVAAAGAAGTRGAAMAGAGPAGPAAATAAAGAGGGAGASANIPKGSSAAVGVVWLADAVVDLEVEARLRDLMDVLPSDVKRQVVRAHLSAARRQLVAAREAYASALARYQARLHLEQFRQQLLKEAGVDVAISLQPPQAPRMRVLPPKSELKVLIVQGMDLLLQQLVAARSGDAAKARATWLEPGSGCGAKCNN